MRVELCFVLDEYFAYGFFFFVIGFVGCLAGGEGVEGDGADLWKIESACLVQLLSVNHD